MGFGDELMLTGIVKKAYERRKRPIALGRHGKNYLDEVLWGEVFDNNPKIDREPGAGAIWVDAIKGNRPYIDYHQTFLNQDGSVAYKDFRPEPGEIFFSDEEKEKYTQKDFIYIEPNVKGSFSGNKDWGFEKWQEVVKRVPATFIQGRGRRLDGVEQVDTPTFRDACALLSRASGFVGTDGGLHHAAAALGKPAVVVWGGVVGPDILGYDSHYNLRAKGVRDCGSHKPCQHCKKALEQVTIDEVVDAVRKMVNSDIWNDTEGRN